jgi:hypothetical protein
MASAILGALISAVGTAATNIALSERQRKFNEQYQDKMNEYSLPENQVQRLKDAGINPNSVAMGGSTVVNGNSSAPINPYTTPQIADPMSLASNSFLSLAQGSTEEKMRDLRVREAEAKISNMMSSAQNLDVASEYQTILNGYAAAMQEAALSEKSAKTAESWSNVAVARQVARKYQFEVENTLPEELKKIVSERKINVLRLDEILALIDNYKADTALKGAQKEEAFAAVDRNEAQAGLAEQQEVGQVIENRNAQDIANAVLKHYAAAIEDLKAKAHLSEEEAETLILREIINSPITNYHFGIRSGAMEKLGSRAGLSVE